MRDRLVGVWRWLVEPVGELDALARRRARLLASVLVVLVALGAISAVVQLALVPDFVSTFVVVMAAVGALTVAWALARSGRVELAGVIASGLPIAASAIAAIMHPGDLMSLPFVLLGVILASVVLSIRAAAVLGAVAVGAVLVAAIAQPALPVHLVVPAACFVAITTALLLVAARHRDLVEQDRLAEQDVLHERLLRADRLATLGTMSAVVAHEVNNPLVYVSANVELVRRSLRDRPDAQEMLDKALEGVTRITAIVGGLTQFARGNDDTPGPADVEHALESAIAIAELQIRHRARLVRSYQPVPLGRANAGRLEQVFINLLLNAAQAIPVGDPARHEIQVRLRVVADYVEVDVVDSGVGIPTDKVASIFEPFFTTKPNGEGTGLGLAVCREIVTGFGGRIDVESTPGGGTTFRVGIPAAPEATVG
jgi:signal transduction histidine kinase